MAKYWTVDKAQGAVKAAYFSKEVAVADDSPATWLRFSEIKRAISETESAIGDRTLSRALRGLVALGQLRRKVHGRVVSYGLVVSKVDLVSAFARAEAATLEAAGNVGGRGDSSEGWAVFGLPEIVPRAYAVRLKKACRSHQEELRSVLEDFSEDALDAVLKPARKKVSRKEFDAGKSAAWKIVEYQLIGTYGLAFSTRFWGVMEKLVPGSLRSYRKGLVPHAGAEISLPQAITALAARISGKRAEELRPEVEKQLQEMVREIDRLSKNFQPLWEALTPRQQERATRRLQAATAMTAGLTSVVHA